MLWLALVLAATACDEGSADLDCGAGTIAQGDSCVPAGTRECGPGTVPQDGGCVVDGSQCGAGTRYDSTLGECVAETLRCGVGTVLVEGECVLEGEPVLCASGTVLVDGRCIVSGEACAPGTTLDTTGVCIADTDIACGAGTRPQDGVCVPDSASLCAEGSSWDVSLHACVPDVVCRADQVAHDGYCISQEELDATMADVLESVPDDNDPAYLGLPELLVLPAMGDSILFSGGIAVPSDVDGDTLLDQDVDGWGFAATAGDLVRVSLRSLGAQPVGFRIVGPNGYTRTSPLYVTDAPSRYLWLPHDGEYRIEIAPQSFLDGVETEPFGDALMGYAAALERVEPPLAQDLVPGASVGGGLLDLRDNLYRVRAPAATMVELALAAPDPAFEPVLVVLDGGGNFVTEAAPGDLDHAQWLRTVDDAHVLVDYTRATGLQDAFDLSAAAASIIELGALGPDASLTAPAVSTLADVPLFFGVDLEAGQVVETRVAPIDGQRWVIHMPDGTTFAHDDYRATFFVLQSGRYIIESLTTRDLQLELVVTASTPVDLGTLDLSARTTAQTSLPPSDRDASVFVRVEAAEPMWLELAVSGMRADNWLIRPVETSVSGLLWSPPSTSDDAWLEVVVPQPQVVVFDVRSTSLSSIASTLELAASPLPQLESEPNDTFAMADTLVPDGVFSHGWLHGLGDVDRFRVSLAQPLGGDELLEIAVLGDRQDVYSCSLRDATGQQVLDALPPALSGCVLRAAALPAGEYHLIVSLLDVTAIGGAAHYRLRAARVSGEIESEPNDELSQPIPLGTRIYADIDRQGDVDRFAHTVTSPQPATEAVAVSLFQGNARTENVVAALTAADGGELFVLRQSFWSPGTRVLLPGLDAGDLRIEATGQNISGVEGSIGRYSLLVEPVTLNAYVDPGTNSTFATAHPIALPATVHGTAPPGSSSEFYAFTLPSALAPGERLTVSLRVAQGDSTVNLEVLRAANIDVDTVDVNPGIGNRITWTGELAAGTYVIEARSRFGTVPSSYVITAEVHPWPEGPWTP